MELFLAPTLMGIATFHQDPAIALMITVSTAIFSFCYLAIKKYRLFHPETCTLTDPLEAEWRSRIVSMMHAIPLSIGSLMCFNEWDALISKHAMNAWHIPKSNYHLLPGEPHHFWVIRCASFFLGYLQYDLMWMIFQKKAGQKYDVGMVVHHVLFIAITHYNLKYFVLAKTFAWLSFCEFSTPFLNMRWFYAVRSLKETKEYFLWSTMFMISFIAVRWIGYGLGIIDIWKHEDEWKLAPTGSKFVLAGIHFAYILNILWGSMVFKSFLKNLRIRKHSSKKE